MTQGLTAVGNSIEHDKDDDENGSKVKVVSERRFHLPSANR